MNSELKSKLENLALQKTRRFCLSCYTPALNGRCPECFSDDLAFEMAGVGVDWSLDFAIEEILRKNLNPVDLETAFEEFISGCYTETISIGFLKNIDVSWAIKNLDPVSWEMAKSEYFDNEESAEIIFSLDNGSTYYSTQDLELFLEANGL